MSERDLARLQARLDADRKALAESLDSLGGALAPDRLSGLARDTGQAAGLQALEHTRANPVAFALIGAGLALLLGGAGRPENGSATEAGEADDRASRDPDTAPAAPGAAQPPGAEEPDEVGHHPSAQWLYDTVEAGLDRLGPRARKRVLEARHKAIRAQAAVEARSRATARKTRRAARRNPLETGVLALGAGTVLAALLPMSRRERDVMGRTRDALMDEARTALADEIEALATRAERTQPEGVNAFDLPSE